MKYLPLVWAGLRRNPLRTLFTILALVAIARSRNIARCDLSGYCRCDGRTMGGFLNGVFVNVFLTGIGIARSVKSC